MDPRRVLVCGSRSYPDDVRVFGVLDAMAQEGGIATIIEGGALGADRAARRWAMSRGFLCETFEADWDRDGRAAGPKRNARMLELGKPDVVVAFPGGPGTADMVRRARAAGVPVVEVVK